MQAGLGHGVALHEGHVAQVPKPSDLPGVPLIKDGRRAGPGAARELQRREQGVREQPRRIR